LPYQDRYQIHVLSLAGFAGVPRVAGPLIENAREGLAAYIRTNHLEKPVIVGHSLGGFLAWIWLPAIPISRASW